MRWNERTRSPTQAEKICLVFGALGNVDMKRIIRTVIMPLEAAFGGWGDDRT
jgi:hypothetical protein